jgi:hypothetical protein
MIGVIAFAAAHGANRQSGAGPIGSPQDLSFILQTCPIVGASE